METLLHTGVNGKCIYFVHPPADSSTTCINNYAIESAVQDALNAAGVTVYKDSLLAQWNDGQDPDPIHSASFTTSTKPFRLECSVSPSLWTICLGRVLTSQGLGTLEDCSREFTAAGFGVCFQTVRVVLRPEARSFYQRSGLKHFVIIIYWSCLGVCLAQRGNYHRRFLA